MKSVHSHDPHNTPLVEWRHDRVGCAVLEFQSGQCHFGSSPRRFLGRTQRGHPADTPVAHKCMQEGDQEEEETLTTVALPGSLTKASFVESLVASHIKGTIDSISEEALGIDRKLPEATRSSRCGESSSRPCQT